MTSYVSVAEPIAVPITMFMRFCELDLSSLKMGNSCPTRPKFNNWHGNSESSLYILCTSESKNLNRECREKARCEFDEMDISRW
jgi:hypothetical protein